MIELVQGNALNVLRNAEDEQFRSCITSPPYWGLRDYDSDEQIGNEETPDEYVDRLVEVFREVRRTLTHDGTLWVNLGDSYARNGGTPGGGKREMLQMEGIQKRMTKIPPGCGLKPKDLVGVPWMVAFALRADGWYLRSDIIWSKPNPMPESTTDRPTKAHEYVFLLSKSSTYYFDIDAIKEPAVKATSGNKKRQGRPAPGTAVGNQSGHVPWTGAMRQKRDVWTVASQRYETDAAHPAMMPELLVEPCVLAGSQPADVILDPFCGSGTVGAVALRLGRSFVGIDLNPTYLQLAVVRTSQSEAA